MPALLDSVVQRLTVGTNLGRALVREARQAGRLLYEYVGYDPATAPADTLRDNHYAEVGGSRVRTTLLEPAETNALAWSENLAEWTASRATVSAVGERKGFGSCYRITESADANASHRVYLSHTAPMPLRLNAVLEADGRDWVALRLGAHSLMDRVWFNLSTGTVGTIEDGHTAGITALGDGLYHVWVEGTPASPTPRYGYIGLATQDGIDTYTGDGTGGVYFYRSWTGAASYVPTYGAVATRAADVLSKTLAAGTVRLRWYDAAGAAQEATEAHGGGTYTVPVTGGRAYYEIDLDTGGGYASAYRPGDATWTHTRGSAAPYTARNPVAPTVAHPGDGWLFAFPDEAYVSGRVPLRDAAGAVVGTVMQGTAEGADTADPLLTRAGWSFDGGDGLTDTLAGTRTASTLALAMTATDTNAVLWYDPAASASNWGALCLAGSDVLDVSSNAGTPSVWADGVDVTGTHQEHYAAIMTGSPHWVELRDANLTAWSEVGAGLRTSSGRTLVGVVHAYARRISGVAPSAASLAAARDYVTAELVRRNTGVFLDPPAVTGAIADQHVIYE